MSFVQVTPTSRLSRVRYALREIGHRLVQYRVYRTTLEELQSLGDHELADLGLHRSMLRSVAHKAAYGA